MITSITGAPVGTKRLYGSADGEIYPFDIFYDENFVDKMVERNFRALMAETNKSAHVVGILLLATSRNERGEDVYVDPMDARATSWYLQLDYEYPYGVTMSRVVKEYHDQADAFIDEANFSYLDEAEVEFSPPGQVSEAA